MKRIIFVLAAVISLAMGGAVYAIPFSDVVNFTDDGSTWIRVYDYETNSGNPGDTGYVYAFSYEHSIAFDPPVGNINSAVLSLTHRGNAADQNSEAWFMWDNSDSVFLGFLSNSLLGPVTDSFALPPLAYASVWGGHWSIVISVDENTFDPNVPDGIKLDQSILSGDYSAVPEPTILMLMGGALFGLAGYGRKKIKH